MNRRRVLQLGAGLGALTGVGLYGRHRLLPPRPSRVLEGVDVLARRFHDSLNEEQRAKCCVDYEHPLRQYHNRGVWGGGLGIFLGFDHAQRALLTDLLYAGLSEVGRARVPEEYYTRWPGVHSMRVLLCGDPAAPPYQILLTGAHVNLRIGGKSREGVAFGGPQVYGDQRGDGRVGLPENLYREQFALAQRLLRGLDPGRRRAATLSEAPIQTQIELRGRSVALPGIPVAEFAEREQTLVAELVAMILSTWPAVDADYALACLAANGGLGALHFSTYEHGCDGPIPEAQVFRLEGPAAVFHFRGHPHVHAFVNVGMDGESPLSVGEVLGENPSLLEGDGVQALFERALRAESDCELAYYPRESVVGRLRAGTIRSGDVYVLESWQESTVTGTVLGARLGPRLRGQLAELTLPFDSARTYTVATSATGAEEGAAELGRLEGMQGGGLLRDIVVAYLRSSGFHVARPG